MALLHGLHAQVFPRLNLPCFSDVLWRATVGRCARKSAACAELWGLIFLCRVKVHTVRVFQWPSWRALASQNLLGSGFLVHRTHPYRGPTQSPRVCPSASHLYASACRLEKAQPQCALHKAACSAAYTPPHALRHQRLRPQPLPEASSGLRVTVAEAT